MSRVELKKDFIGKASRVFNSDSDTIVQSAAAGLMMQSTGRYGERALERIALHPNDDIRKLGRFFWKCRNDFTFACDKMKYIFSRSPNICDNMSLLFVMSSTENENILRKLLKYVRQGIKDDPRTGIREMLVILRNRVKKRLGL